MHVRDVCNAAGFVTLLRLPVAVAAPFLADGPWLLPAYVFALFTDVIDGPIARRTGTATPAGAALDGWLDKILHVNLAWSLAVADRIPDAWMLAWFSREILQAAMIPLLIHRFRLERGPLPRTSLWGRATAVLLAVSVLLVLAGRDATLATAATGLLGTISGVDYGIRHLPHRRERGGVR